MRPVVSIIGRPNVGKSTLFNRLVGRRRAIVHGTPGVTRDRIFSLADLIGGVVWLVDTGGLEPGKEEGIPGVIHRQVEAAAKEANLLLAVFDGCDGLTSVDEEVISKLRRTGKPIVGVVNKVDPGSKKASIDDFHRLGLESLVEISAEHGSGLDSLRETILARLGPFSDTEEKEKTPGQSEVAFVGRPNVGKSSLINAILRTPRMAVSEIPGTTRDVIDTPVVENGVPYLLLDTAGIRKRMKVDTDVEYYSVLRALRAIDRADVVVLVVDATGGITTQDARIAAAAIEKGTGLLVAVNKWDLVDEGPKKRNTFREDLYAEAPFLSFADVKFVSAKTGLGVDGILSATHRIFRNLNRKFTQAELTEAFDAIGEAHPPMGKQGYRLRMHKLTEGEDRVLTFFVWCNDPRLVDEAYVRYWRNAIGERFELWGVPLRVIFRKKAKK
ncbi:MAG: ribosome biogenesis GTPase Der [Pseudomonadota bacterium]